MTDKQIIIDEVKCPWFNDGSCDLFYSDKEECWYRKCKDTPNCYYRETQTQLKAKEQECERLQEKLERQKDYTVSYKSDVYEQKKQLKEQLDQLKAENDELKRYKSLFEKARDLWNEASKTNYKLLDEIEDLKDSLKRTICQSECYRYKEAEKLKQTLTELGTILTHCMQQDICTTCDYSEECNLGDEEIPTYDICKFLLNKINQHQ